MSVTHCAGSFVTIGPRTIQRCAICGEKLSDTTAAIHPLWPMGALVRFDGDSPAGVAMLGSVPLPDDFCLALVEA